MEPYLYFGSLGPHERQFQVPNFIGLALEPAHDREIRHNLTDPLPYPDASIARIQAQDVLEHLPFDKVPLVLDEIYRVLKPGGTFRLSVPDSRLSREPADRVASRPAPRNDPRSKGGPWAIPQGGCSHLRCRSCCWPVPRRRRKRSEGS